MEFMDYNLYIMHLDQNFSFLIGSADDRCVPWNTMDIKRI